MNNIWWERVPNARTLVEIVSEEILNENNLLLKHRQPLPWKDDFADTVIERVEENNSSKNFKIVEGISEPGKYLLDEYCKAEKRASFRPSVGYPKFFAENDDVVIHNKFFWVNLKTQAEIENWIGFVRDYCTFRKKDKELAVFILDCPSEYTILKQKGIKILDTDEFINEYDKIVYATLVSGQLNEPTWLKSYLTELMKEIACFSCEIMDLIAANYRKFLHSPYRVTKELIAESGKSLGVSIDTIVDEGSVENSIWKAQIKILYPLIEEYRKTFVEKHFDDIAMNLPIETESGGIFYRPQDVELGGLIYMVGTARLSLPEWEYKQLETFRDARNILSHLGILSWTEIEKMVGCSISRR